MFAGRNTGYLHALLDFAHFKSIRFGTCFLHVIYFFPIIFTIAVLSFVIYNAYTGIDRDCIDFLSLTLFLHSMCRSCLVVV